MTTDAHEDIVVQITRLADEGVRVLATVPHEGGRLETLIERLTQCQQHYGREFPHRRDELAFWEALWLGTDCVREQWNRIEKAAARAGGDLFSSLQRVLDDRRRDLCQWTRQFIVDHAPRVPTAGHFELGIETTRPDHRERHERIEGLYESIKRIGRLPEIIEGMVMPAEHVNVAIIYGGGWNVSTFSVLREAANVVDVNAFVAFDHPGCDLFAQAGGRTVRVATAGLVRTGDDDDYVLARFARPVILHFVCPHEWTGVPPHELGIPVLRSAPVLDIVNNKIRTTQALKWYAHAEGVDLPLIREWTLDRSPLPADLRELSSYVHRGLAALQADGVREVVVKPSVGEQEQGVGYFKLPGQCDAAVDHAVKLSLESAVIVQERIRMGETDFNWRLLVARSASGDPKVVGRFARKGHGDDLEMVRDSEMLSQMGVTGAEADAFLDRLDDVARHAFRAVSQYAAREHRDFPWRPLSGGSYTEPYFLGVDLIGDRYIMEINGNEVAGMWTDDRLYPATRGRSNRTVLESAQAAAQAYRAALSAGS